jgi:molybdate transport system ATP-binding protein
MTLSVDIGLTRGDFSIEARFQSAAGITILFGRSGSGKTTLLNAIAGLVKPGRGRIEVNGRVLFDGDNRIDVPTHRRRLGYVFQDARLLPHLTVRHNLAYGYRLAPEGNRPIGTEQVVELLGIGHLLERRPAGLSGGERQRVAIGRALLANPVMLLMDEPLASLDNARRAEILRYIERLRDELRIPIVYVSHAIEEVVRLADSLVLLDAGAVVASGPVTELMQQPELQAFTGGLDAGAVIEARVGGYDSDYDMTTLVFPGGTLLTTGLDARIGDRVRVRIRAREVAIALSPPPDVSVLNVLQGRITHMVTEPSGAVDVNIAVGEVLIYARLTRLSRDRLGLSVGQEVYALIKAVSLDRQSTGFA